MTEAPPRERILAQDAVEGMLARALHNQRLAHAYLFLGPSGIGKYLLAKLFARALACRNQPAATESAEHGWRLTPCETCDSCRRARAGTHPELLEIVAASKTGQDITADQAREIRRNAALRPKLGTRRVYLIPHAEHLNDTAANALLKTLEEPADFLTLLLCAPDPARILSTIRSRCQLVRCSRAGREELTAALLARGIPTELAEDLARTSGGRPGLAFRWAESPETLEIRDRWSGEFLDLLALRAAARSNPSLGVAALRHAERLLECAEAMRQLETVERPLKQVVAQGLEISQSLVRDLLIAITGGDFSLVQNFRRRNELNELAPCWTASEAVNVAEATSQALEILDRNVQPLLVLERYCWSVLRGPISLPAELLTSAGV